MTPKQIDTLISRRNRITSRYGYRRNELNRIDRQLAQVPAGQDNRVDQALGRPSAQLTPRADYGVSVAQAEQYRLMSEGQPNGMIEHDDWLAGAP